MCMYSFPILCFISVLLVLPYGWNFILPGNPGSCTYTHMYYVLYNTNTKKSRISHWTCCYNLCSIYLSPGIAMDTLHWQHVHRSTIYDELYNWNGSQTCFMCSIFLSNLFLLKIQSRNMSASLWWLAKLALNLLFLSILCPLFLLAYAEFSFTTYNCYLLL